MLRHILGFLLGIVLTPALAYAAGWGATRSDSAVDPLAHTITDKTRLYGAFALMAAAGLVTGVIIMARWASPMISLVPALAFIGWSVYFLLAPQSALDVVGKVPPAGDLDDGLRTLLGSGIFALVGFALFAPAWTAWRWHAPSRRDEPVEEPYF
jgi:hypothetical protein